MPLKDRPKIKYLVIDDEIAANKNYQDDFVADIGLKNTFPMFAGSCEKGMKLIKLHPDLLLCYLDCRIPFSEEEIVSYSPTDNTLASHGLDLIPKINNLRKEFLIIIHSAYVEKSKLVEQLTSYNNILECIGKGEKPLKFRNAFLRAAKIQGLDLSSLVGVESETQGKVSVIKKKSFTYSNLDSNIQERVKERAEKIKLLFRKTAQDIVDIGQYLTEVKDILEYGQFGSWIELEIGLSLSSASRLMRVYEHFKSVDLNKINIVPSAMYQLVTGAPDGSIDEVVSMGEQGEVITLDVAKSVKKKYVNSKAKKPKESSNTLKKSPQDKKESSSNNQITSINSFKQDILQVIPLQRKWKIGRHQIFCCDPNDKLFLDSLPDKVDLVLSYPSVKNWNFNYSHYLVGNTFYCEPEPEPEEEDFSMELEYSSDIASFQNKLKLFIEEFRLEYAKKLTLDHTDENSKIIICFIPNSDILVLLDKLGCQAYIAEPSKAKCLKLVNQSGTI